MHKDLVWTRFQIVDLPFGGRQQSIEQTFMLDFKFSWT